MKKWEKHKRILGIDTNTHYLALSYVCGGEWGNSLLLPFDGPERRAEHQSTRKNNRQFEKRSALERLDVMIDLLEEHVRGYQEYNGAVMTGPDDPIAYVYIEEPPFVNSVKGFAELTTVVQCVRQVFRSFAIPVSLVNVGTWKKETTGNGHADKSEVRSWVRAHVDGFPQNTTDDLIEDQYDALAIAWRGAVAAGQTR